MTSTPTTQAPAGPDSDPLVEALRPALLGPHTALRAHIRDVVTGLADLPRSGLTYWDQAALAPGMLRSAIAGLGGSAVAIAADPHRLAILCQEAAVSAPRLLPILTGHFDLAIGGIRALSPASRWRDDCLAGLDSGTTLGALCLTELGGTNGADHRTIAVWDPVTDGFRFYSPNLKAAFHMPNAAGLDVPLTVLVAARLMMYGRDEGVFLFLLPLRTEDGLVDGVDVVGLPDKEYAPMPHGDIRFRGCWAPRHALLGRDWARITEDGRLDCEVPQRERWTRSLTPLGDGRLHLALGAMATARAGLGGLVNFARQRESGGGTRMIDRDAVQSDIVAGLISVYTASILGRLLQDMRAGTASSDPVMGLWSMLAKPALTVAADDVLLTCQLRTASHGATILSRLGAWRGNVHGSRIAEGENQILCKTAGRLLLGRESLGLPLLQLPGTPNELPEPIRLLAERERVIAAGLCAGNLTVAGPVLGPDSAAIALAVATTERALATAPIIAAAGTPDSGARELLIRLGEAYARDRLHERAGWFHDHPSDIWQPIQCTLTTGLVEDHRILLHHLPQLVTAFDVPDLPDSPLNGPDYTAPYLKITRWGEDSFINAAA